MTTPLHGAPELRGELQRASAILLAAIRKMPNDIRELHLTEQDSVDMIVVGHALVLLGRHAQEAR